MGLRAPLLGKPLLDVSQKATRTLHPVSDKQVALMTSGRQLAQWMVADPFDLSLQNMHLVRGLRIRVPRGTRRVWIPRTHHYAPKVYNNLEHTERMERHGADLNPCVVTRNFLTGFGWHRCAYHMVYIEEVEKTNGPVVTNTMGPLVT